MAAAKNDDPEALYQQALAFDERGKPALSLAFVGAAIGKALLRDFPSVSAARRMRARLRKKVSAKRHETPAAEVEEITHTLIEWRSGGTELQSQLRGAMEAMLGAVRELDTLTRFHVGASTHADAKKLSRDVPDSPDVAYKFAWKCSNEKQLAMLEEALRLLRSNEPRSADARRIEELQRAGPSALTEAVVLGRLVTVASTEELWDRAAAWASELTRLAPDDPSAWVARADALTFGQRHEEALRAYDDAWRVLTRTDHAANESDARPRILFNKSCLLAKLGRRDEALAELRRAIRMDPKNAAGAKSDDYWKAYRRDREFVRLTSGDAQALVDPADADEIKRLVALSRSLYGAADRAERQAAAARAVTLAELGTDVELLVVALTECGHALDGKAGLEHFERAWALAERDASIAPETRVEAAHALADALEHGGKPARAMQLYEQTLAMRIAMHGESHPAVAKVLRDIATFQMERVARRAAVTKTLARGIELLERFLVGHTKKDAAWGDATADLGAFLVMRAHVETEKDAVAAVATLDRAVTSLEAAVDAGWRNAVDEQSLEDATKIAVALAFQAEESGARKQQKKIAAVDARIDELTRLTCVPSH